MRDAARGLASLEALLRRWHLRRAIAGGVLGLGLASLTAAAWTYGNGTGSNGGGETAVVWVTLCGGLAGLLPWVWRSSSRGAGLRDLARHLDRRRPELGESTELLLSDTRALEPLVRIQQGRVADALAGLSGQSGHSVLPWRGPLVAIAAGVVCAALAWGMAASRSAARARGAEVAASPVGGALATTRVRDLRVSVAPPAYTGRAAHESSELNVQAEQGARVAWRLRVEGPGDRASLLFGDEIVAMPRSADGAFLAERLAATSELYAVRVTAAGREVWHSPSARLEVLPDRAPLLEVESPAPLTEVSPTAPGSLVLAGRAGDDYGLAGVELLITAVAGGGEQISVHEERRALTLGGSGRFTLDLDLARLGVAKDTELYLRVEVADRRAPTPNRTRSETLRVRAVGPQALAASSLDAGLRLQPVLEFFRSERQIILDTEKLRDDEPHMARSEFEQRSQRLAFDQRALRLRYGALLGEEFESGVAVEAGAEDVEHLQESGASGGEPGDEEPKARVGFAKPKAQPKLEDILPAGLVHQHDAQDEATFFTSTQRTALKAVLAEMWDAEGALRVFDLKHALPFEYRALKLLKDLQQSARVYVPKIGYEAPEIDLARRLQGELDKIHDLSPTGAGSRPEPEAALRRAWGAVSNAGAGSIAASDLSAARQALSRAALAGDADALAGVDALRALEAGSPAGLTEAERTVLSRALWRALPVPTRRPAAPASDLGLERDVRSRAGGAS